MKLPDLSYMTSVGQLRYIQNVFEHDDLKNPDEAVIEFLSFSHRLRSWLRGRFFLSKLRENPFYPYVVARTKYYDDIFIAATKSYAKTIINIGCGTDTRAHRFTSLLVKNAISIVECDQKESILHKKCLAEKAWPNNRVKYLPLDLNLGTWPELSKTLIKTESEPCLIMLEGVSPYIESNSFKKFLLLLASKLHSDSIVAYDFKRADVANEFGRNSIVSSPFRLPDDCKRVSNYHNELGLILNSYESSSDLVKRLLPEHPVFNEDCLITLSKS